MTEKEILRSGIKVAIIHLMSSDRLKAYEILEKALADTEDTGGEKCPDCKGLGERFDTLGPGPGEHKKCCLCNGTGRLPPKEQDDEEMDLHGEIMNLRIKLGKQIIAINEATEPPILSLGDIAIRAYKRGHRDARHGAAELACEWQASKGDN
jgi:hypothetical protein